MGLRKQIKHRIKKDYVQVDQEEMTNIMSTIELVKQGDVNSPSLFLKQPCPKCGKNMTYIVRQKGIPSSFRCMNQSCSLSKKIEIELTHEEFDEAVDNINQKMKEASE